MEELKKLDFELAYEIDEAAKKQEPERSMELWRLVEGFLIRMNYRESAKSFKRAVIQ